MTSTSVRPFLTARWMTMATRLSASSSDTPDGLVSRSISAFFSASALAFCRIASDAFSASASASCSITCLALGRSFDQSSAALGMVLSVCEFSCNTITLSGNSGDVLTWCEAPSLGPFHWPAAPAGSGQQPPEGGPVAQHDPLACGQGDGRVLLEPRQHA